jgi:hypothetical protein
LEIIEDFNEILLLIKNKKFEKKKVYQFYDKYPYENLLNEIIPKNKPFAI